MNEASEARDGSPRDRRSFLRKVVVGLGLLVPAVRGVASPQPSHAGPAHFHCGGTNLRGPKFVWRRCIGGRITDKYVYYCAVEGWPTSAPCSEFFVLGGGCCASADGDDRIAC